MSFRVGETVVINLNGSPFNGGKNLKGEPVTEQQLDGKEGTVISMALVNRERMYTVEVEGFSPIRIFERDLIDPKGNPIPEAEEESANTLSEKHKEAMASFTPGLDGGGDLGLGVMVVPDPNRKEEITPNHEEPTSPTRP